MKKLVAERSARGGTGWVVVRREMWEKRVREERRKRWKAEPDRRRGENARSRE